MKRAVILQKPSGTIAIGGNMNIRERKFYNGFLKVAKDRVKKDPRMHIFTVPLKELKKYLNVQEADKHNTKLKEIIRQMHKIDFEYNLLGKDKTIEGFASLLDNVKFITDNKSGSVIVKYSIPEDVRLAMIKKDNSFAIIDLVIIKGLRSKYSVLLYELVRDYKNVEIPEMSIDKFRKLFGLDTGVKNKDGKEIKKYTDMPNMRKRVLDVACNELTSNPNIDFEVSYKLFKTGKAYTSIKFLIKPKQQKQQIKQQLDGQWLGLLLSMLPERYRSKTAEKLLSKYKDKGDKYVKAQIEYTNNAGPKQYMAYLRKALENDYAGFEKGDLTKELERQEEERRRKRKEAELKKKLKEEEERKQLKLAWESLDEEKKNEYIAKAAIHNTWLRQVLIKGEKDKHEELVEEIAMEELKKYMQQEQ